MTGTVVDGAQVHPRYGSGAIAMHWIIAALLIGNLAVGWRMGMLKGMEQFAMFQLHKSIGITVLMLSVLRLAWRLLHPALPMVATMSSLERLAAAVTHWVFYAVMIGLPLTGWAIVSVSPYNLPTLLWQTIPWPHIAALHELDLTTRAHIEEITGSIHSAMAWGTAALVVLHIGAALRHHFLLHDGVLARMVPWIETARRHQA